MPCLSFPNPVTNTRVARSVLDYETKEELHAALEEALVPSVSDNDNSPPASTTSAILIKEEEETETTVSSASSTALNLNPDADWVLTGYDPSTTHPQTLEHEYQRLITLQSYDLLDSEPDQTLERLTAMAGRMLRCPIAYVGTMDLGRYNILAGKGLGTLKDVHRKGSYCEHVLQSTQDVVVITDSTQNASVQTSWFTREGPQTRFYAAAKLVAPEGCVLGTLCVIDPKPRPEGLSLADQQNLLELAEMTVDHMVQRKKNRTQGSPAVRAAMAAHDLITPLTGIDLSLGLLKEDDGNLTAVQRERLANATRCLSVVQGICRSVLHNAREAAIPARCCEGCQGNNHNHNCSRHHGSKKDGVVQVSELVQKIASVMEHHPKRVPLVVSVDPDVPDEIVSNDLHLFRCAMNYLTRACRDTQKGMIRLRLALDGDAILFECEDTGPGVSLEDYPKLFHHKPEDDNDRMDGWLGLYSVAQHMDQMGGTYGYRPRQQEAKEGSVFWFRVPLQRPDAAIVPQMISYDSSLSSHDRTSTDVERSSFASSATVPLLEDRTRTALVIEDTLVVRKVLSRCLSKLGFEVAQAENGFVGLQKLKDQRYDLVLCDFLMPVLDGVDCVEQFRAWEVRHRPPGFRQYIVGISAHAGGKDADLGLQAGMNDFRPKPVTMKHLKALQESDPVQEAGRQLDRILAQEAIKERANESSPSVPPVQPLFDCLVAAESHSDYPRLVQALDPTKWRVVVVHDGTDALQLLKVQNWDLVVLDDDLPRLSGTRCALRFREWEKCHRIHRQRNVLLASAFLVKEKMDATQVLMPYGFEGMLEKPYQAEACQELIRRTEENHSSSLTSGDIIAR